MSVALITGSCGLVGSESALFFSKKGFEIVGIDNNSRRFFFGKDGDTGWIKSRLKKSINKYYHYNIDIRSLDSLEKVFKKYGKKISLIIHSAAQPSHDWAKTRPFIDFDINAKGTLNLLELNKRYCPETPFIFMSTNKVYGDNPNLLPLKEKKSRWEINSNHKYYKGIDESMSIDRCTHSFFGASKAYADLVVQEYGKNVGLKTACFRAGCITGPNHSGAELHGFLSYLVKVSLKKKKYTLIGYKGKQVRDNLDASDIASFVECFAADPRSAAVYNIGGGKGNSCSILEAVELIESILGRKMDVSYEDLPRVGDHICYYSDLSLLKSDYPNWSVRKGLRNIVADIIEATS